MTVQKEAQEKPPPGSGEGKGREGDRAGTLLVNTIRWQHTRRWAPRESSGNYSDILNPLFVSNSAVQQRVKSPLWSEYLRPSCRR